MRYCPECGIEIQPNSRFCGNCGLNLESIKTEGTINVNQNSEGSSTLQANVEEKVATEISETVAIPIKKKGRIPAIISIIFGVISIYLISQLNNIYDLATGLLFLGFIGVSILIGMILGIIGRRYKVLTVIGLGLNLISIAAVIARFDLIDIVKGVNGYQTEINATQEEEDSTYIDSYETDEEENLNETMDSHNTQVDDSVSTKMAEYKSIDDERYNDIVNSYGLQMIESQDLQFYFLVHPDWTVLDLADSENSIHFSDHSKGISLSVTAIPSWSNDMDMGRLNYVEEEYGIDGIIEIKLRNGKTASYFKEETEGENINVSMSYLNEDTGTMYDLNYNLPYYEYEENKEMFLLIYNSFSAF